MNRNSVRTQATRKKIMDTFADLLTRKEFKSITVSEIVKSAGIHRSTFYEHFLDVYDVLDQYENELLEAFKAKVIEQFQDGVPKDYTVFSSICTNLLHGIYEQTYRLAKPSCDPSIREKIKNIMLPVITDMLPAATSIPNINYIIEFTANGLIGMLNYWYEQNKPIPFDEVFETVRAIMVSGISAYAHIDYFSIK